MRTVLVIVMVVAACRSGARDATCRGAGPLRRTIADAQIRWRAAVGTAKSYAVASSVSSVVVRVDDLVIGLDPDDGRERFRRTIAHMNEIAVAGDTVVVATLYEAKRLADGGAVYAGELVGLDARTGSERWRKPIAPHVDHFLVRADEVFFSTSETLGRQSARAIRVADGATEWSAELPAHAEIAAIAGERLLAVGDELVLALDVKTGVQVWKQPIKYLGHRDGIAASDSRVYAGPLFALETHDLHDGRRLATTKLDGPVDYRADLFMQRDRILIATRKIYRRTDPPHPRPGDVGTLLIGIDGDGRELFRHDVTIGSTDADRRFASSFVVASDRIVAAVDDQLHMYSSCDVSDVEVSLGAHVESGLAASGSATYALLAGGELVRVDVTGS